MRYQSFQETIMEEASSGEFSTGSDFDRLEDIDGDWRVPSFLVEVKRPRTTMMYNSQEGPVTTYDIVFETTEDAFRLKKSKSNRRYSDFEWLRRRLSSLDKFRSPPELPPKRFFGRFDEKFVEKRRAGLEQWMKQILSDPFYLSDMGLHLFLQTEWTIQEIQDYLDGKIPVEDVEELFNNNGKKFPFQAHNPLHQSFEPHMPVLIEYIPEEDGCTSPITVSPEVVIPQATDHTTQSRARLAERTPDSGYFPDDGEGAAAAAGPVGNGNVQAVVADVHDSYDHRSGSRFSINADSEEDRASC